MINVLLIIMIFFIFLVAWLMANVIWKIIEGKMMVKIQDNRIDALYAKLMRIAVQAAKDYKKGGFTNDNL